ncbi:MAG: hypothetical protein M3O91_00770, partial [Chloroflexota bacterium]|nr:hypothetical protein [Chloroflexota bacterium]
MTAKTELSSLEASGLIRLAALEPDIEYLFRHALVQDAAYSSLPKQERRELHARAAEVLLSLYPQRERELGAVLGMHFEQAGDTARAARHFVDAGEHALERFANQEAGAFFDRAYGHLSGDALDGATLELRLRAAVGAAKAGWTFVPVDTLLDRLQRVIGVADGTAEPRLLGEAHFWVVFLRRARGDTPSSSPELQRSLDRLSEIGDTLGDPAARAIPQAFVGLGLATTGRLRAGAELLENALDVMEAGSDPLSAALLADLLTIAYARLGEFAAAERAIGRSERLAERGDAIARLDSMIARSTIALERGDVAESAALSSQCAVDAEALGAVGCSIFSNLTLGEARLELDQPSAAKPALERGHELSIMANIPQARTAAQSWL